MNYQEFPPAPEPHTPCMDRIECGSQGCDHFTSTCCDGGKECHVCQRVYCRQHGYLVDGDGFGCETCLIACESSEILQMETNDAQ